MTVIAEDLKLQLAQLPTADRAELASFLLDSLPAEFTEADDEAWAAELNRRVTEIESGLVTPIPAAQVLAELRSEFP